MAQGIVHISEAPDEFRLRPDVHSRAVPINQRNVDQNALTRLQAGIVFLVAGILITDVPTIFPVGKIKRIVEPLLRIARHRLVVWTPQDGVNSAVGVVGKTDRFFVTVFPSGSTP